MLQEEPIDQAGVIAFLSSPDAHGGVVPERIDTHLSHIFLGPDYVLKLKRCLKLHFVDYSTVVARKAYCQTEVDANAWAEGLYLGIEPVSRRGEEWFLGPCPPDAETLDWVVKMVRFPDDARADKLLKNVKIDTSMIERFADDLADRHAHSPPSNLNNHASAVEQRIEQIGGDLADALTAKDLRDPVRAWSGDLLKCAAHNRNTLTSRVSESRIRSCHGDLHLKNIVRWPDRLVGFDALEFDAELTEIDALYDAAFPAMDLLASGAPALANAFTNRYFARADDYSGLGLFPLYCSMRAGVRALASALSGDTTSERHYFDLARTLLHAGKPPRLIAIGGRSGTGKSTLARAVAPGLHDPFGAIIIRSDLLRKTLANAMPESKLPEAQYTPESSELNYLEMFKRAGLVLKAGFSCILDATFLSQSVRDMLGEWTQSRQVPVQKIWLDAPADTLRRRISARKSNVSDADLQVLQKQLKVETPGSWTRLDVSGSVAESIANLQAAILADPRSVMDS